MTINELIEELHRMKAEHGIPGTQEILTLDDNHSKDRIRGVLDMHGDDGYTLALDVAGIEHECDKRHCDDGDCDSCEERHCENGDCADCERSHCDDGDCAECEKEHVEDHECVECEKEHVEDLEDYPCKRGHVEDD